METLRLVLLLGHVLGYVALIGGLLAQARTTPKRVTSLMCDGVGTSFVTGLLLVGILETGPVTPDHVKIAVKFAVGLVLLVLVMANLRKDRIPTGLWVGMLVLALLNVVVAIFWAPVHVSA